MTSACGICGSAGIAALRARRRTEPAEDARIDSDVLAMLPERMQLRQPGFKATGGIHAAALFRTDGTLLAVREDVGRHNAVDKVIGAALLRGTIDLGRAALAVSGRCGYEIAQKAIAAGIPIVASVSAPTSLAVRIANEFGLTLAAFVREGRWNVYSGESRIAENL
jgi:FdhD protein